MAQRGEREETKGNKRRNKKERGSFSPPLTKLLLEKKDLFLPSSSYLFYFTALDRNWIREEAKKICNGALGSSQDDGDCDGDCDGDFSRRK